jgi:hypothetical protein
MMNDFEVGKAVSAIYDAIKGARLKAGLPTIYIEDSSGQEKRYSIRDILSKKEMPGELTKTYFEFGNDGGFSLICLSHDDCRLSTDNFIEEDEASLNRILKQIDLRRPLPAEPSFEEYEPEIVSLARLFPEPEMPAAPLPEPQRPATRTIASNDMSEQEFKKYVTHILRENRNTPFYQIMEKYSSDGFKLPRSHERNMRRKDQLCEWYNQVRKKIKMDLTSNYGNAAPPKAVQQKIPAARQIVAPPKEIVQKAPAIVIPKKTEPKPVQIPMKIEKKPPEPIAKKKEKPKAWDDQKVLGIVKAEYEKKHNFSQTLATLSGMSYKLNKPNKNKVFDYFTELMGD